MNKYLNDLYKKLEAAGFRKESGTVRDIITKVSQDLGESDNTYFSNEELGESENPTEALDSYNPGNEQRVVDLSKHVDNPESLKNLFCEGIPPELDLQMLENGYNDGFYTEEEVSRVASCLVGGARGFLMPSEFDTNDLKMLRNFPSISNLLAKQMRGPAN